MLTYYPSLPAIEQQSHQVHSIACHHCRKACNLLSQGFIRKKQHGGAPRTVGKRVFCSNRRSHHGCGRTSCLYLETTIARLHATAGQLSAFVGALVAGVAAAPAYLAATGGPARHVWRWLDKLRAQLPAWRSLAHQPPLPPAPGSPPRRPHQAILRATLSTLCGGPADQSVCAAFQRWRQHTFM